LKDEELRREFDEKFNDGMKSTDGGWKQLEQNILSVGK
jgi:hypothetical protein